MPTPKGGGVAAARFQGVEMSFLLVPVLLFGVLFDVAFTCCAGCWRART